MTTRTSMKQRPLSPAEEMRVFWGVVVQPFVVGGLAFISFPVLLVDHNGRTLAGGVATDVIHAAGSVAVAAGIVPCWLRWLAPCRSRRG